MIEHYDGVHRFRFLREEGDWEVYECESCGAERRWRVR